MLTTDIFVYGSGVGTLLLFCWVLYREMCFKRDIKSLMEEAVRMLVAAEACATSHELKIVDAIRDSVQTWELVEPWYEAMAKKLDRHTKVLTTFNTFDELVEAPGYTLSIDTRKIGAPLLIGAYNLYMKEAGFIKRAHIWKSL